MWHPCQTILDEPARIWIFTMEDLGLFLGIALGGGLGLDILWSLLLAAGVTGLHYRWRRGKPPGYLFHRAHALGLLRLPGLLSRHPTHYKAW